ncbi:MAG: hypothetical protein LBO74_04080, partial [Candidatus Symbiothrix sp.]|nr:hypothetical protein [Candidatus Symbiothrix sp.]
MKQTCLINAKKDEKGIAGQARNDRPSRMKNHHLKRSNMRFLAIIILCGSILSCSQSDKALREAFQNPDNQYKPMPLLWLNGQMTTSGIEERLRDAKQLSGFGGVAPLPVSWGDARTEPTYLSDEYFDRYGDMLRFSEKQGTEVILYDDIDYPSGTAGGRLQKEYPQFTRKLLIKEETLIKGPKQVRLSRTDTTQLLMAASALNTSTLEVIDLAPFMKN